MSCVVVGTAELMNDMCLCCTRSRGAQAEEVELNRLLCGAQQYGFVLGPTALHCHTKQGHIVNKWTQMLDFVEHSSTVWSRNRINSYTTQNLSKI